MSCSRSHCAAKRVPSASARGSASMRRACFSSVAGADSLPLLRQRRAAPDPAACPRGRTTGATRGRRRRSRYVPPGFARRPARFSKRKMKCGLARIASSARAHAGLEPALRRAPCRRTASARSSSPARERPPVRLAAEAREDLPRARALFRRRRRPAAEDLLAARRLGDAGRLVRSLDDQVAHVRQRRDAGAAGSAAGERPVVRPDQIFVRTFDACARTPRPRDAGRP